VSASESPVRKRTLFREVNERIRDVSRQFGLATGTYEVLCECSDYRCAERVVVPGEVFDDLVARGAAFVVSAGHEEPLDLVAGGDSRYRVIAQRAA
jgi:hypothetical protein